MGTGWNIMVWMGGASQVGGAAWEIVWPWEGGDVLENWVSGRGGLEV